MPPGFRDELLVSGGIEEDMRAFLLEAGELVLEIEVAAVRAEENVARQRLQHAEGAREILRDARIRRLCSPASTKRKSDQKLTPPTMTALRFRSAGSPGRWTGKVHVVQPRRVAGRLMRGQRDAAELDGIAVEQDPVDLRRRIRRHRAARARKSVRPPLSTTSASPSMTMFFAPVSRRIWAAPAM